VDDIKSGQRINCNGVYGTVVGMRNTRNQRFVLVKMDNGFTLKLNAETLSVGSQETSNPPRVNAAEYLGRRSAAGLILEIDRGQFLPGAVPSRKALLQFLDRPGGEAAGRGHWRARSDSFVIFAAIRRAAR
jgi:hypothetical protein